MELRRYYRLIRQRLLLVVIALVAGAAVGFVVTSRTPSYTATAIIYVGDTNLGPGDTYIFEEGDLNEVVATYAVMIPQPVIAQRALDDTHINRFAGVVSANTTATVVTGTQLIDVSVTDTSSADAIALANGVSHAFVAQVSNAASNSNASEGAVPNEPAHVYQEAITATSNSSGLTKRMILGAVFGLIISIFVILLLDYLDITIKSPDEFERRVGLPVLGIVPRFETLRLDASPVGARQGPLPRGSGG